MNEEQLLKQEITLTGKELNKQISRAYNQGIQEAKAEFKDAVEKLLTLDKKDLFTHCKTFAEERIKKFDEIEGIELIDKEIIECVKELVLELAQTIPKTLILLTKKIKQELLKLLDNYGQQNEQANSCSALKSTSNKRDGSSADVFKSSGSYKRRKVK